MPLTADRAKPAVPVRRHLPADRLRAVQPGQLAATCKIVVLTQYKSHSLDRHITKTWRMSTLLGNYVAPVPAQQRRRQALVPRQRRRDLPEPQPRSTTSSPTSSSWSAPTTSTGWTSRRWSTQHIESGAGVHRRRRSASRSRMADQFGVIDVDADDPTQDPRVPARSRPTPPGLPDAPDEVLASMGNYVFNADALVDAVTARRRRARAVQARHGRRHRPVLRRPAARPASTTSSDNDVPGSHRPRPRLLARRRDARLLLRRPHGPRSRSTRSSTSTTTSGRSTPSYGP